MKEKTKNILQAVILIAVIITFGTLLFPPTIANAQDTNTNVGIGFTPGRIKSLLSMAVGLLSVVIGGLALARSKGGGQGNGLGGAKIALVAGLLGVLLAVLHLANTTGGFGTGGGRAGAIVALALGLTGVVLGGVALTNSRKP